ncbi:MAG: hypothetical protein HY047_03370 [Acidobacteria bacterium]|nr:hypothetical protein [Acidobacteriota bacterium]
MLDGDHRSCSILRWSSWLTRGRTSSGILKAPMYHRQVGRRRGKEPRRRGTIEASKDDSYVIAIDHVRHKPFSEAQFNQFAQQVLNVLQRATASRCRPHDRSIDALLLEEIPGDLWEKLKNRAEHDAVVHGRGAARVHDVVLRLLRAYAHVGLQPIETLSHHPLPPAE